MLLKLISWFTGRKIIWLKDFQDRQYRTIELKPTPFGLRACYVYWITRVGYVTLLEGGKTGGPSNYINEWKEDE